MTDALASLRDDEAHAALERICHALLDLSPPQLSGIRDIRAPDWRALRGDRDTVVPLDADVATMLGGALHRVSDAGHMPQVERSGFVNGLLPRRLSPER